MFAEVDVLTLCALVVGLQSVVCVIGVEWVKAKVDPLKESLDGLIKRLEGSNKQSPANNYSVRTLTDIAVEMQHMLEVHSGLIHDLVSASPIAKSMPNLSEENRQLRDRLEKAMQELMLISSNDARRESAIQQLSQTLGDQQSLERMKEAEVLFPNDSNLRASTRELSSKVSES
jgi:paraquat-inducible protein B